jgi:hypothetical protein
MPNSITKNEDEGDCQPCMALTVIGWKKCFGSYTLLQFHMSYSLELLFFIYRVFLQEKL